MDRTTPAPARLLRRAGLLGDLHGHSSELAIALNFLSSIPDLDALLCTGDIPGTASDGDTNLCCRLLADHGVEAVLGNHDRWAVENAESRVLIALSDDWPLKPESNAFLRALPATREFDTPRGPALLCHGTGADDLTGVYPGDSEKALEANLALNAIYSEERIRFLICGHTHQRMVRRLDHLMIINGASLADEKTESLPMRISPGTVLRRKNPCFSVIDFAAGAVQFYNIVRATDAVVEAERFAL